MKLLTVEIRNALPKLYATDGSPAAEKIVQVKFFAPAGRGTWYALEFDGEDTFFGYVVSPLGEDCDELGYFSLSELESVRIPVRVNGRKVGELPIERDLYFTPQPLAKLVPKLAPKSQQADAQGAREEAAEQRLAEQMESDEAAIEAFNKAGA